MKNYFQFSAVQYLKTDIDSVWKFASSPKNLKIIVPDYILFNITSKVADRMYPGMIVAYQVAPLLKIKLGY